MDAKGELNGLLTGVDELIGRDIVLLTVAGGGAKEEVGLGSGLLTGNDELTGSDTELLTMAGD